VLKETIKKELKSSRLLFISDDLELHREVYEFLKDFCLEVVVEKCCDTIINKYFQDKNNSFDLIIINMELLKVNGFAFISSIRKIDNHIPYLFITKNNDTNFLMYQEFKKIDYVSLPINYVELLNKVHSLTSYAIIKNIVDEYRLDKHQELNQKLQVLEQDLEDMLFLIDDFEIYISDMICSNDINNYCDMDLIKLHKLLHKTYNLFYTFIDEDIKEQLEPFAISVLSLTNCLNNINCDNDGIYKDDSVSEVLTLLLEDILKFITETAKRKKYINTQYFIDSFISNVSYLETKIGISDKFTEDDTELDFF
jgi:DNA-binding NarL/FixJ family response regulator